MSMKTPFPKQIPEATARVVEKWLPEDNVYRYIGGHAEEMVRDEDFEGLYHVEGRGGINPVVLALVTVFQFVEKLPDRAAAEMVRSRMDWKYALRQALEWEGFDYTDLCNFRKRLLAHQREQVVFEGVLKHLKAKGYVRGGGKQRVDSTHVLGQIEQLSRLEGVWESIRLALSGLISTDARWTVRYLPSAYVETHTQRRSDYRMSKAEVAAAMQAAGEAGYWLVDRVREFGEHLLSLAEMVLLQRVLAEQFTREDDQPPQARKDGTCPANTIASPHDPEVGYGNKGTTQWHGFKLHVSETANDDEPVHFITDVTTTAASLNDSQALETIQQHLQQRQLAPDVQYGDQGYVNGTTLASSQHHGIDLRGYVDPGHSPKPIGFRLTDFDVNVAQQHAVCPAGHTATDWQPVSTTKNVAFRISFGSACQACPFFGPSLCTHQAHGRRLDVSRHHDLLQARRRQMQSSDFVRDMHRRNGIEATISELVRAHGVRQARYRGQAKYQLQAFFTAAAANLKRLVRTAAYPLLVPFPLPV